jgi:thiosulfate/3-mercaptopyruvate sulfurtransferase
MKFIITTNKLNSLLYDKNKKKKKITIIDARTFSNYADGHIPSAINADLMQFHWIDTSKAGIAQFDKQMQILLLNLGITKNRLVIFYNDISGPSAARGVWLLNYFSHSQVLMLDGGFEKWKKDGYSIETKSNPYLHSSFSSKLKCITKPSILATYKQIKYAIQNKNKNKNVIIVDSRSNSEFNGSVIRAAKAGHIPNAINIDWNENIENGIFKNSQKLRKVYSNIPRDTEVITYCQGGYRAANSFIALKMLGYKNVKVYLGSWGEWGNMPDLPIEK